MCLACLYQLLVKGKRAGVEIYQAFPNGVFNILLMSLSVIIVSPVTILYSQWINLHKLPTLNMTSWDFLPNILVILCAVFCGDFISYWRHRFEHSWFLCPSHMLHHSDTKVTWLTLQRFHPINRLSTYIIDTSFLLMLGLPVYAIIANNFVRHYYGYFIHVDLSWTYGRWGMIFVSPVMHRWHHVAEASAHNTNYATVFSIFDQYFGTYRVPGQCTASLGVSYISDTGLLQQLLYPFLPKSYRNIN